MSQRFNIVCATFKIRVMHGYVWRLSKGWKVLGHLNNLASPLVIEVHVPSQESERTCTKPGKWKDMYKTNQPKQTS